VTLLLVEDTARLAEALARGLTAEGFEVEHIDRGLPAIERLAGAPIEALVLDLGLPDCDGLEVLAKLRASKSLAPVLVLTARDAVASRVAALEAGADDYLVKPFAFEELVARLRALIRRSQAPRWAPLACGDLELLPDQPGARVAGALVPLSPRERAMVDLLLRRQGEIVSRDDIFRLVFGYEFDPGTNVIDVHIAHLRRKLRGSTAEIRTIRGQGLMLVETSDSPEADDAR